MFCPHCGKEFMPAANFCSSCGAQSLSQGTVYAQSRVVRPRHPRMIAGVCSGIAIHYGWDIALVRIVCAVLAICTSGLGLIFYIAAWIFLPDAPYALPPVRTVAPPQAPPPATSSSMNPGSAV